MKGKPPNGSRVYTLIGYGKRNPAQVLVDCKPGHMEVVRVITPGGIDISPGDEYGYSSDLVWKPETYGRF